LSIQNLLFTHSFFSRLPRHYSTVCLLYLFPKSPSPRAEDLRRSASFSDFWNFCFSPFGGRSPVCLFPPPKASSHTYHAIGPFFRSFSLLGFFYATDYPPPPPVCQSLCCIGQELTSCRKIIPSFHRAIHPPSGRQNPQPLVDFTSRSCSLFCAILVNFFFGTSDVSVFLSVLPKLLQERFLKCARVYLSRLYLHTPRPRTLAASFHIPGAVVRRLMTIPRPPSSLACHRIFLPPAVPASRSFHSLVSPRMMAGQPAETRNVSFSPAATPLAPPAITLFPSPLSYPTAKLYCFVPFLFMFQNFFTTAGAQKFPSYLALPTPNFARKFFDVRKVCRAPPFSLFR